MGIRRFKKQLTVTAGAYSANDVVGGRIQFNGVRAGKLRSITITDAAAQLVDYVLVFFESVPTDITDNATFDIADGDLDKIIYDAALTASATRRAFTDNSYHFIFAIKDVELLPTDGSLWAFLITLGTPTYAATTDVTVTIQIDEDG